MKKWLNENWWVLLIAAILVTVIVLAIGVDVFYYERCKSRCDPVAAERCSDEDWSEWTIKQVCGPAGAPGGATHNEEK